MANKYLLTYLLEDDGQEDNSDAGDPDQLSLATLEAQFERRTPLNQW